MILILSIIQFTLTSKGPRNPNDFYTPPCIDQVENNLCDARISLYFPPDRTNIYRRPAFVDYVPNPDLRLGIYPGGEDLSEVNNYYCSVVITTDGCKNWEWSTVFNRANNTNSSLINVKLPPTGYNTKIKVTYYERSENLNPNSGSVTPDFNINTNGSAETRVVYRYERTFLGGFCGVAPFQVNLYPNGNVSQSGKTFTKTSTGDVLTYFSDFDIIQNF